MNKQELQIQLEELQYELDATTDPEARQELECAIDDLEEQISMLD